MQAQSRKSCPVCGHWPMHPLKRYFVEDVSESPTVDSLVFSRPWIRILRGAGCAMMLASWLVNLLWGKAMVARDRAKVKKAREEILPRSPSSLICPNCFEVLEILGVLPCECERNYRRWS